MGCPGSQGLVLLDPLNRPWIVTCDDTGNLVSSLSLGLTTPVTTPKLITPSAGMNFQIPVVVGGFTYPGYYALSSDVDGTIICTPIPLDAAALPFYTVASPSGFTVQVSIQDDGILVSTPVSPGGTLGTSIPYPKNVTMSSWPSGIGVFTTLAPNTPTVVNADMSIWSCILGKYVNEDTTNIIVVLEE